MNKSIIAVVMGSRSDSQTIQPCLDMLEDFAVAYELMVLSAHRQPGKLLNYIKKG